MAGRNIIVLGGSAGAVEALSEIVSGLPADLPASLFVVVHFPSYGVSMLPGILSRAGRLKAVHAADGDAFEPGMIYAAPPDHHLLVKPGRMRVVRGPRENGHRPAVDPLFRTAAASHGDRVIAVVLSGNLDDGTAGLAAVRRRGGVAVVQHPEDALYPGMPASAAAHVDVHHLPALSEIAPLLVRLVNEPLPEREDPMPHDELEFEADIAEMTHAALRSDDRPGVPSGFTCPECHGALWEIRDGDASHFRCRVGHAFGGETLMAEQASAVEAALWTAFQALKERSALSRRMAERMEKRGNGRTAERYHDEAAMADQRASLIHDVLRTARGGGPPAGADTGSEAAVRGTAGGAEAQSASESARPRRGERSD